MLTKITVLAFRALYATIIVNMLSPNAPFWHRVTATVLIATISDIK